MADLRERCKAFYQQQGRNAMLRQGDPVEDLLAFVTAETGRTADPAAVEAARRIVAWWEREGLNQEPNDELIVARALLQEPK